MKKWSIQYWDQALEPRSVEQWFDKLTEEQFKSVAKELKMLELAGNSLKMPHTKALGDGLFELRERRYGYRVYYGFCKGQIIILLGAGDKKSQKKDINIARKRLEQF